MAVHTGNSGCICFVCRNFPQGTIGDMVEDVSQGISFVCNNVASYGGDPGRFITIAGL
jgi:prenylcysteine alpha-carboxyl methylesterase